MRKRPRASPLQPVSSGVGVFGDVSDSDSDGGRPSYRLSSPSRVSNVPHQTRALSAFPPRIEPSFADVRHPSMHTRPHNSAARTAHPPPYNDRQESAETSQKPVLHPYSQGTSAAKSPDQSCILRAKNRDTSLSVPKNAHEPPISSNPFADSDSDSNGDTSSQPKRARITPASSGDEDPLDAFMSTLATKPAPREATRAKIAPPSPTMSFPCADGNAEDDDHVHNDAPVSHPETQSYETPEDAARAADEARRSLTLPAIDHSKMDYTPIHKELYIPLPRHSSLTDTELLARATTARVSLTGGICPIDTFADLALALPRALLGTLMHAFNLPTPVQRAALPAALAGNDILATADTGSGKTLAYLIPLIAHVRAQRSNNNPRGGRALVLAPTRELAAQIAREARRFGAPCGVSVVLLTGGGSKLAQARALRDGGAGACRVLVATPGRLIDMVKMRAVSLTPISALALDEADRMLDLGFGAQVGAILSQIQPDAQRLLLSATLSGRVRALASDALQDPVVIAAAASAQIAHGNNRGKVRANSVALVAADVNEEYVALRTGSLRWQWLKARLRSLTSTGLLIVFCRSRGACAALANLIRGAGTPVACVHGETDHADRVSLLSMFRKGDVRVLVSTDLAARGLDIGGVSSVVNYEPAKDWEWHVHRVGRTGRAGKKGDAYTLLSEDSGADNAFAQKAVDALRKACVDVPEDLAQFTKTGRKRKGAR